MKFLFKILLVLAAVVLGACAAKVFVKIVPEPGERIRIAVLPFKDAANAPGSGNIATETLSSEILQFPFYDVIDRTALDKVIEEQKLGQTGLLDQGAAVEIGKLVGADAVLYGAITEFKPRNYLMFPPAKVSMSARLINTQTGQIEWSSHHGVGGGKRWLTWILWPVGIVATVTSPSAEDQIANASRCICRGLNKEVKKRRALPSQS